MTAFFYQIAAPASTAGKHGREARRPLSRNRQPPPANRFGNPGIDFKSVPQKTKFIIDIAPILFYVPAPFRDRGFYEQEWSIEKDMVEPGPASPGPPVAPRPSRDG